MQVQLLIEEEDLPFALRYKNFRPGDVLEVSPWKGYGETHIHNVLLHKIGGKGIILDKISFRFCLRSGIFRVVRSNINES